MEDQADIFTAAILAWHESILEACAAGDRPVCVVGLGSSKADHAACLPAEPTSTWAESVGFKP